ncbi:hypothetical protein Krac_4616 [Ktedonobacter racemifer DSM 44963]|uniref:Uncharacterized protein n=1 Tax=Ktedonobacter racemifer DSM 44963 TaxID=485913 RepID=D6TT73_KTERA|nr:hypothetical protein Krac_4616 [Ktedonobacter racemifer DSM 44963]
MCPHAHWYEKTPKRLSVLWTLYLPGHIQTTLEELATFDFER